MQTSRLEAFSDGVIAIIITIMVLEFKVPEEPELSALAGLLPTILSYIISFVFIGIYWVNHHHLLHAAENITGGVLWLNLNLLFWLSLIPFTTAWMDESFFASFTVALYGLILAICALSYYALRRGIAQQQSADSILRKAAEPYGKIVLSLALQITGVAIAFIYPWIAVLLYVASTLVWAIPETKIERSFSLNE